MFPLHLLLLAFLAASTAQSGIPEYIREQWVVGPDEPLLYEDPDGPTLPAEETILPQSDPEAIGLVIVEEQKQLTTPEPHDEEQPDPDGVEDSSVWKIVLVVAVLLVSTVGSLSMAYYMCVWRGGRIYYQPQKQTGA